VGKSLNLQLNEGRRKNRSSGRPSSRWESLRKAPGPLVGSQVAVGMLLLYWIVLRSDLEWETLTRRWVDFDPSSAILGCICFLLAMGISSCRFGLFLPEGISSRYLLGIVFLQNALLTFLPWRVGEIGYPLLMRRDHQIPVQRSASIVLLIRLMDLGIVLGVAALGAPQLLPIDRIWFLWAGGLGCAIGILLWIRWRGRKKAWPSILTALDSLQPSIRFVAFFGMSLALFGATTFQSLFILQAAGLSVALWHMALLNALTLLAAVLPIHPPGGWGTIDSVQVLILEWMGYGPHLATPSILAAHAFYSVLIFVGGMAGWFMCQRPSSSR
jgi:uncharacterized membrane protein YbhN (UPF0104 family)